MISMKVIREDVVSFALIILDSFHITLKMAFKFTQKANVQPFICNTCCHVDTGLCLCGYSHLVLMSYIFTQ